MVREGLRLGGKKIMGMGWYRRGGDMRRRNEGGEEPGGKNGNREEGSCIMGIGG
jgi:hypothetical protein